VAAGADAADAAAAAEVGGAAAVGAVGSESGTSAAARGRRATGARGPYREDSSGVRAEESKRRGAVGVTKARMVAAVVRTASCGCEQISTPRTVQRWVPRCDWSVGGAWDAQERPFAMSAISTR
jgi:hypothetical protein